MHGTESSVRDENCVFLYALIEKEEAQAPSHRTTLIPFANRHAHLWLNILAEAVTSDQLPSILGFPKRNQEETAGECIAFVPVGDCDSGSDELPGPEEEEAEEETVESVVAAPSRDRAGRFRCPALFRRAKMDFRNVYKAMRIRWSRKCTEKYSNLSNDGEIVYTNMGFFEDQQSIK